jgi:hypothetical protein
MMTDPLPSEEIIAEDQTVWHTDRQPAGCNHCQRLYLVPADYRGAACPLCRRGKLEAQPAYVRRADPEQVLPFRIAKQALLPIYQQFISPVWIRPEGLNPEALLRNTHPVFWPLWLVDSDVSGHWQMEAGFDYQVESAKEVYTGGSWQSRKQIETRVRWETRVGSINTRVDNVVTPALEEHENRRKMAGNYHLEQGSAFDPALLGSAFLELPNITPQAAWPLARPGFDQTLAGICQKAASAQHFREFSLKAHFDNQNWTEYFLPMYATHYTDDEGQPQVIVVNGETGAIQGPRLASRQRGNQIAGIVGAVAGVLFLLALIGLLLTLVFPPAALIAGLVGILGLIAGILAIIIAIWPGQWNRSQVGPRITERP